MFLYLICAILKWLGLLVFIIITFSKLSDILLQQSPSYKARFQMHQDSKILLNCPPKERPLLL